MAVAGHIRNTSTYPELGRLERLDPSLVAPGRWCDRLPVAMSEADPSYRELRSSIAMSGGNVSPGVVRPLAEGKRAGAARYEIVSGHRRHRACLELGLPFLAHVVDLDDRDAVVWMARENEARKTLSAYEIGRRFRRWLDEGLVRDQREISTLIGLSVAQVSRYLAVVNLPDELLGLLRDPRALSAHAAATLRALWSDAPPSRRAEALALGPFSSSPRELIEVLSGEAADEEIVLRHEGRELGVYRRSGAKARIELKGHLGEGDLEELSAWLAERLAG